MAKNCNFSTPSWFPIPSADPLIDCATTSFAIRLPMHDRGSGSEGRFAPAREESCYPPNLT